MKLGYVLLFVAFVGLSCSVNAYQSGNIFDFGALPKVVSPLAVDTITLSPDDESIQQAVDEIATKGNIYLTPGIYSKPGDYDVKIIGKDISIVALDDGVVVDAGEKGRLFNIDKNSKVSMERLSLYNGRVRGDGACINNSGELSIINCNISKNTADETHDDTGYAGAIYNTGNCKINNSFLSSNEAQNCGGAIANFGTCTVDNSEITNITSLSNGGVFYNTGNFTVSNTNIYKNTAYKNGGIIWNSGNFTSISTEFSKSVATKNPLDDPELLGGGVLYNKGDANIINSTLKNCSIRYNAAGNQVGGGAIVTDSGSMLNISGSLLDNHRNIAVVALYDSKFNVEYSTIQGSDGAVSSKSSATVKGCKFINNTVALKEEASNGGAINSAGSTDIADSIFDNNVAGSGGTMSKGGAIYSTAALNVVNSNFTDNKAIADGGAIFSSSDDNILDVSDSIFTNNKGHAGGAIYSWGINVSNSNFTNNAAEKDGGAIFLPGSGKIPESMRVGNINKSNFINNSILSLSMGGDGGAISTQVNLNVFDSDFTGNVGNVAAGAIRSDMDYVTCTRSTIFKDNKPADCNVPINWI